MLWARIVEHASSALARPSINDLATVFGVSKSTVKAALDEHQKEWEAMA